jgi:23S rRNA (cytidine1920-2'-O)/16S rRNA (cytidine1409-2'-O)-methyltransferase
VYAEDEIRIRDGKAHPYVSRGGLKLQKAIESFSLNVAGMVALDVGAAAGGFTDVLLQNGAKHVFAVDVGYGQLDMKIRTDARVTVLERTNARYLTPQDIGLRVPDITVMDASFISVTLLLPAAAQLMQYKGIFCILIKPQFEAGRENVGKHGVVRDTRVHEAVIRSVRDFAASMRYAMIKLEYSPIKGPAGNIEYLALLVPAGAAVTALSDAEVLAVVQEAENRLSCIE